MRQQINISHAAGKTVERVGRGLDLLFVTYTDGTFSCLMARESFGDPEIIDYDVVLPFNEVDNDVAIEVGIFTKAEHEVADAERTAREAACRKDARHRQYMQLKAEFEQSEATPSTER